MNRGRWLELEWSELGGSGCLRVRGWTEAEFREFALPGAARIGQRLAVVPSELMEASDNLRSVQPIAGRFEFDQDAVCFIPRFPFQDGISYSLLVDLAPEEGPSDDPEVWTILRPVTQSKPTTAVVAIYPSADELPVNQLKLYIYFSSPMSEGWADRAVQVHRADNNEPLDGVFLATEPELWDRQRQRLTLLLDPGRIKRGLAPNEEAGYPLMEGVAIIVTIDPKFRDSAGFPMHTGAERRYEISPAVRTWVDPTDWRCHFPRAGSTDPLTVEFDRPLDHALLQHSIWVNDRDGRPLAGRGSAGPGERSWCFEPQSPWEEGRHLLIVDPRLEDLAGNSLIRVFDRDLTRAEDAPPNDRHATIEFTCAPSPNAPPR